MARLFSTKKSRNKAVELSNLLDDLTHLEINTVIKNGMVASSGSSDLYDITRDIFDKYTQKFSKVIHIHNLIETSHDGQFWYVGKSGVKQTYNDKYTVMSDWGKRKDPQNYRQLHIRLKAFNNLLKLDQGFRINDSDYIILRRIASFCEYIMLLKTQVEITSHLSKSDPELKEIGSKMDLYYVPLRVNKFVLELKSAQQIKFKRVRDLGIETILMQTRIGIDGDVVTRIEKDFAQNNGDEKVSKEDAQDTKKIIIDLHEKHIDISVKYWKSLIEIIKDFVSGIVSANSKKK